MLEKEQDNGRGLKLPDFKTYKATSNQNGMVSALRQTWKSMQWERQSKINSHIYGQLISNKISSDPYLTQYTKINFY